MPLIDWRAAVTSVITLQADDLGRYIWARRTPGDAAAKEIASRHGVSLEGHVARKVTRSLLQKSDLILVMEPEHLRFIASVAPEIRGKSLLFGQWLETKDIPDPYCKSREAFEYVFEQLGKSSQEWARRLRQQGMKQ